MALHPDFHQWLSSRGVQPATITKLQKESILQESTLKLLTDSDLDSLKRKHGITLGQFAVLRNARDDLCETEEDDFEVIELDDVTAELAPRGEERGRSRGKSSTATRNRVGGDREGVKRLWGENLEKVARRERHLRDVADASEGLVSSATEYGRLATLLAEKRRKEAGEKLAKSSCKSNTSGKTPSTAPDYDHLDNFLPPTSKHACSGDTDTGPTTHRNSIQVKTTTSYRHDDTIVENFGDSDGYCTCCNIM